MDKLNEIPRDSLNMVRLLENSGGGSRVTVPNYYLEGHIELTDKDYATLVSLLFHGGHLTINYTCNENDACGPYYSLRFPNLEVQTEYFARISMMLLNDPSPSRLQSIATSVKEALDLGGWGTFIERLKTYYSQIPWNLYKDNTLDERPKEKFYQGWTKDQRKNSIRFFFIV